MMDMIPMIRNQLPVQRTLAILIIIIMSSMGTDARHASTAAVVAVMAVAMLPTTIRIVSGIIEAIHMLSVH